MFARQRVNLAGVNPSSDLGLGLIALTLLPISLAGLAVHAWLGMLLAGAEGAPLLLSWQWGAVAPRRRRGALSLWERVTFDG